MDRLGYVFQPDRQHTKQTNKQTKTHMDFPLHCRGWSTCRVYRYVANLYCTSKSFTSFNVSRVETHKKGLDSDPEAFYVFVYLSTFISLVFGPGMGRRITNVEPGEEANLSVGRSVMWGQPQETVVSHLFYLGLVEKKGPLGACHSMGLDTNAGHTRALTQSLCQCFSKSLNMFHLAIYVSELTFNTDPQKTQVLGYFTWKYKVNNV